MYRFAIVSPETFDTMQARAAIGITGPNVLPTHVDDVKATAARFVAVARREAATRAPHLKHVFQALKPGDVRAMLETGQIARVQIADALLICGTDAQTDFTDLPQHRKVAATGAKRRREIAEVAEVACKQLTAGKRAELKAAS